MMTPLPTILRDRLTRRVAMLSIVVLTLAVPLFVWAAATIPAGCATPGDCDELTPTFTNLTVKELLRSSGALVIEEGAAIDGTTFVVDEENDRVGIGTDSPADILHLQKNQSADTLLWIENTTGDASAGAGLRLRNAGWDGFITARDGGGSNNGYMELNASDNDMDILFSTEGTERARIDGTTGRFGIGTTSPSEKLEVVGTISGATLHVAGGNTTISSAGATVFNEQGNDTNFRVESDNGTHALFVDASADAVGIGESSPARSLHISDTMRLEPRSSAPSSPSLGDIYVDSDSNELCFYDGSSWTGLKAGGACS